MHTEHPSYHSVEPSGNRQQPVFTTVYLGHPEFHGFDHKSIRSKFVAKVYSILCVQLLFTCALIAWFTFHKPTKQYFNSNGEMWLYAALGVGLVVYLVLVCAESARRSYPMNFLLLILLTVSYGLMAAILSSRFQTTTVLSAFSATAIASLIVLLMAKYSSIDITNCGCGLCILSLLHLLVTVVLLLTLVPMGYADVASTLIAGLGAFLVSLYLLFDMQLIMGGRSQELSPEEYILGAVLLYIDIVQLFQYMLILFGGRD